VRWGNLFISFVAPTKLTVVFRLVQTIEFDALRSLNSARHSSVTPFLAIFTLQNNRVHVSFSDSNNIPFYIEVSIDKAFGLAPTLNIPNVYPNDRYI